MVLKPIITAQKNRTPMVVLLGGLYLTLTRAAFEPPQKRASWKLRVRGLFLLMFVGTGHNVLVAFRLCLGFYP